MQQDPWTRKSNKCIYVAITTCRKSAHRFQHLYVARSTQNTQFSTTHNFYRNITFVVNCWRSFYHHVDNFKIQNDKCLWNLNNVFMKCTNICWMFIFLWCLLENKIDEPWKIHMAFFDRFHDAWELRERSIPTFHRLCSQSLYTPTWF